MIRSVWLAAPVLALTLGACSSASPEAASDQTDEESLSTCASFAVTENAYDGPSYWGTITIKNQGASAVKGFAVSFKVPSGAHCTNDAVPAGAVLSPLNGSGSSATTKSNACTYTWTSQSIAAGASFTFNYSTDSASFTSATGVAVKSSACGTGGGTDAGGGTADSGTTSGGGTTEYAPYFYTWGWGDSSYAFSSLASMKAKGGPSAVTLAFVLSNGGCAVTTDIQNNLADVKAYVAAGGHVKASFGGADGTYLESACTSASSLASAISGFVDATGITDLDFDVEQGSATSNATINARRASALKTVQQAKGIRVAFTLPVNPDGLDALGKAVVQSALDAGVAISFVNVMTMDYGSAGSDLGQVAIGSADATAKQLVAMKPGLTLDAAYRMVGATPMIGHNDDSEVFSLANARTLVAWAKEKKLGLLAFWAIQRDEKCPGGVDLNLCSGVNGGTFDFHQAFATVLR